MRLFPNLVNAVLEALAEVFNQNKYADKVIATTLKKDKRWGARDRSFIAQTAYEIVRWKRLYATLGSLEEAFEKNKYSRQELLKLFSIWATLKEIELPNWEMFEEISIDNNEIRKKYKELSKIRKIRESIPNWLDELGTEELGEEIWTKEIAALNQEANVVLRANTLKTKREDLQKLLSEQSIPTQTLNSYPDALELLERKNLTTKEVYKNGLFEIQDASSQLVAPFLDIQTTTKLKVIDACAGAGGKTLHLASLLQNKSEILAMDIFPRKLQELQRRAKRAGAENIRTCLIKDPEKLNVKEFYQTADRVLIDAPCTGLGILRRNPDAKWKLSLDFLSKIQETQQTILQEYAKMLKKGGKLVYATCSVLPSENQNQIKTFLKNKVGREFEFLKDEKVLSHQSGYDGFYMALLEKRF